MEFIEAIPLSLQDPANDNRRRRSSKTWSAKDTDHIPRGRRVLVRVDPGTLHPSARLAASTFGFDEPLRAGFAMVKHRWVDGDYMVSMENSRWSFTLPRSALVYPLADNVEPFVARRR